MLSLSVIDFPSPELPQCGARSETAWLVSQQVVAIATGSHVVMAAVEGRVVAVGRGGEDRGGAGVYRKQWQTINRAYQEPAAESCGLMAPRQIHPGQTHTVCSVCM